MNRHVLQQGFTFLWVILAVAILGVGLLAASEVWVSTARRQRLVEMDWIGAQFTQAIGSYYYATPSAIKTYPPTLQDLIEDPRYPTMRRHLREIYKNPFSGVSDWELLLAPDGGIQGLRARIPSDSGTVAKEFLFQP